MTSPRKLLTVAFILIALALLYPGINEPVLTLTGSIQKSHIATLGIDVLAGEDANDQTHQMLALFSSMLGLDRLEGQIEAYNSTRSILGTARELANTGNLLVAVLVVLFSIVIPVVKLLLMLTTLFVSHTAFSDTLLRANAAIGKWSMADVFVMGLLVAYMAGSASGQVGNLLVMDARLEHGFYYFLAYCLFSIAAGAMLLPARATRSAV